MSLPDIFYDLATVEKKKKAKICVLPHKIPLGDANKFSISPSSAQ